MGFKSSHYTTLDKVDYPELFTTLVRKIKENYPQWTATYQADAPYHGITIADRGYPIASIRFRTGIERMIRIEPILVRSKVDTSWYETIPFAGINVSPTRHAESIFKSIRERFLHHFQAASFEAVSKILGYEDGIAQARKNLTELSMMCTDTKLTDYEYSSKTFTHFNDSKGVHLVATAFAAQVDVQLKGCSVELGKKLMRLYLKEKGVTSGT